MQQGDQYAVKADRKRRPEDASPNTRLRWDAGITSLANAAMAFQFDAAQAETSARHNANGSTHGVATARTNSAGLMAIVSRTILRGLIHAAAMPLTIDAAM